MIPSPGKMPFVLTQQHVLTWYIAGFQRKLLRSLNGKRYNDLHSVYERGHYVVRIYLWSY